MVVFPNAKINLGLSILDKRADGFHNIETVFYPVAINDALEIIASSSQQKHCVFSSSGLNIDGAEEDNLCLKAYSLLKKDFPSLPSIQIYLYKTIPMGAGLGGGSSDAAFALKLLNEKFQLHISTEQLYTYALQLGSDCPFFIINKPMLAKGRGELMEPIHIDLSGYNLLLINPGIHISTSWAFNQFSSSTTKKETRITIKEIIRQPIASWAGLLKNDFEEIVFNKHPAIEEIKKELYQKGALYASLSGSGSTVFGIFKKEKKPNLSFPENYLQKIIIL